MYFKQKFILLTYLTIYFYKIEKMMNLEFKKKLEEKKLILVVVSDYEFEYYFNTFFNLLIID